MIASRAIAMAAATMLAGCLQGGPYACENDAQCVRPGSADGICVAEGWCAYPDETCPSGRRFSPNAGDGLAGVCVEGGASVGATESGGDSESPTNGSGSSEDTNACGGPCTSPPGPCWVDEGACADGVCLYAPRSSGDACDDDDPCSASSACDGEGTCVAEADVVCDAPPSDCYEEIGTCDPIDGECSYEVLDLGSPCEDGSVCTEGDTCDGNGACEPGESCPTDNPCETPACIDDACMYTPMSDGTSCGLVPAARCCAGACVDLTTDPNNCGACAATCAEGHGCESVDTTPDCELAPADTSGRCTCFGNIDCDPGYVCRTQNPYTNLCTPESPDACPGVFVEVNFCPNYCHY